jgi:hypothetical protein
VPLRDERDEPGGESRVLEHRARFRRREDASRRSYSPRPRRGKAGEEFRIRAHFQA